MKPRKSRNTTVNFGRRRSLRLGAEEEQVIDLMRRALAKTRGVVDLDEVVDMKVRGKWIRVKAYEKSASFSEAHRLLLTDKTGANRILSRAKAMTDSGAIAGGAFEIPDEVIESLAECRKSLSFTQGLVRRVVFDDPDRADEVLASIQQQRVLIADIEKRIGSLLAG